MTDTNTLTTDNTTTYHERAAAIADLLSTTTAWEDPTPCEGWTVRDLVEHLIVTQRDFLVERELEVPTVSLADPQRAWAEHTEAVLALLEDPSVGPREYDGHFGRTTIGATMASFYGWDLLVHRWDLARSLGTDEQFTQEELDQIEAALAGFGDALYGPGICAAPVEVAESESRQVRLLARLGRDAR
ncbi:TIGR03086 family metal-binding protein [Ornithinimicrobium faecis]|uniref:TIGR03086 family metal-binding protein n=1 Tax=Ornithinimicrobium faecis TaxID=2934158 RepID=A0ABY4YX37_9MICO|nr:TIGR03086 family metal-binding protein [Ornithinimicrobium sp. HY1793]USQ81341.1 TIGR03086 family metal-binding protein [Ornithinimicrobium sp. HY1793]